LKGFQALTQRRQNDLWNHIKAGASLYISWENSCLTDFSKVTGLEVSTQSERNGPCEFILEDGTRVSVSAPMKMTLHERSATVLAREPHGTAAFSVTHFGQGKVYFLSAPIESAVAQCNEFFLSSNDAGWWKIYRTFAADLLAKKKIRKTNPWIGITEHEIGEEQSIAVLINYQPETAEDVLVLSEGWALDAVLSGDSLEKKAAGPRKISLPPNGFAIWSLKRVSVEKTENRSVPAKEFALA
jgi:hypothetical protein